MEGIRYGRSRLRAAAFLLMVPILCLVPGEALAQAGTLVGEVVDRASNQPINGAQITVEGTGLGSISDGRGRFIVTGLPAGTYQVRVLYIGYRTAEQTVTIVAGESATVRFELGVSAVQLDEVVVTGTAGAVERKQLGASVASVDVSRVQDMVPVANVQSVLSARVPGLRAVSVAGGVGAGQDLRIRGTTSFSLNQRPVIYIDGVKLDNSASEWGTGAGAACCSFSGGAGEDRLSDLNPADIDRIEVIRGAAAGTLYGTEAANGVIQIFTKKGRTDSAPRWNAGITLGFSRLRENLPTTLYPNFTGPDGFRALDANKHLIENGPYQSYDLTVQGGGSNFTYFVSGAYTDEQASIQPNWMKRGNLRLNMNWVASQKLSFEVTSSYAQNKIASLQSGNNWFSLLGNAILGNPRLATEETPYGEPWTSIKAIKDIDTFDGTSRWTGGIALNYNPTSWFSHRIQAGLDAVNEEKIRYIPWGYNYAYVPEGEKNLGYRQSRISTLDYLGSMNFNLGSVFGAEDGFLGRFDSRFSFGAQGFWDQERRNMAVGKGYAGPGVTTVGGATITTSTEAFVESIQLGVFGQYRIGFDDKLFLTAGLRGDGNSAFGKNYGIQTYPSLQASYSLAEESFLPDLFSNLRVRAAVGAAGKAPGAFEKFQTFTPFTALEDQPGIRVSTAGNDDLKPERTTEYELGLEAGLFDDRVGIDLTLFRTITRDALVSVTRPPSMAYGSAPRENIGEIENKGWEVGVRFTPIERNSLRWTIDFRGDGHKNAVTDLGMEADTVLKQRGSLRLGYPVMQIWDREIASYDPVTRTHTRSDTTVFIGQTLPKFNLSWGNDLMFGPFQLHTLVTAEKGAVFSNGDRSFRINFRTGDEYLSTLDENWEPTAKSDSLFNWAELFTPYEKRDNIRIREISLSYSVPASLTDPLGLGRTRLTLAAMNVHWWDDCNCMDPNMNYTGGSSFSQASGFLATPAPRQFRFTVRTSF